MYNSHQIVTIRIAYSEVFMTLDELYWMNDLFTTCNMSRSAENLYISQPALSQCVTRLEKQLGFKLFERSNKGMKPTEKGLVFAEAAKQIIRTYHDFEVRINLMDTPDLKEIRIGMAPYLASMCSADLIRRLSDQYPQIRFSVYDASSRELIDGLMDHSLQVIVVNSAVSPGKFHSVSFGRIANAVFLRKGSPLADFSFKKHGRQYLDPKYLSTEPLAVTRKGQATRKIADAVFREAGISPDIRHESRNMSGLYKYAVEGLASSVAVLTGEIREKDMENGLVYRIPETYANAYYQWQLLMPEEISYLLPENMLRIIQNAVIASNTAIV